MFLQSKILDLQNDAHMQNQTMMELENENNLLKTEILKNQEMIQSKDGLNSEFKNLYSIFKQRFEQLDENNNSMQKYILELQKKIYEDYFQ